MFHSKLVYASDAVCESPVTPDYDRVVNVDEKGEEHITFEKVDYPKIQGSLGTFGMWSLRYLLKAGINPDFGIKTGFTTRLGGLNALDSGIDAINKVVESVKKSE